MRGQLPRHGNFRSIGILPMDDWLEANATQLLLGDRSTAQNLDPSTALGTSLAVTKSDNFLEPVAARQVDDERIEARTLFCFKNFHDRNRVQRVSSETVDGFRGQRDNLAFTQQLNRRSAVG